MAGEIQLNSTTMATESSGTITLSNVNSATNRTNLGLGSMATQAANNVSITGGSVGGVTIEGDVAMASSGLTVRNIEQVALVSDQQLSNDASLTTFFSPTYTPKYSGSKVMGCLNGIFYLRAEARDDGRKTFVLSFTGSDITDIDYGANQTIGGYDVGSSGIIATYNFTTIGPLLTTSGTSTITCNCKLKNEAQTTNSSWLVYGNNTLAKTFFTWIEYK